MPERPAGCKDTDLLLLLLSHFSRVRLCATPYTAAHQAPQSLGFSRQEHWSGCHFLLQCVKMKSESEVAQSCPNVHDPMDCSLPGSPVHEISQARVLEWGAIAFSENVAWNLPFERGVLWASSWSLTLSTVHAAPQMTVRDKPLAQIKHRRWQKK